MKLPCHPSMTLSVDKATQLWCHSTSAMAWNACHAPEFFILHTSANFEKSNTQIFSNKNFFSNQLVLCYLCIFSPDECSFFSPLFCFKKCDYLTMLCEKIKKFIRCSFTATTTPHAPVSKLWKSHNQYLACLPFALTTAAYPCLTEWTSCWIVKSTRCIVCCLDRWHRSVS